jgi:ribosomal 50S subunit-recycling heat shock protein
MREFQKFTLSLQGMKDSKASKQPKPHQTVKLTYSNGSITNISVNITEELGKTSIWRQLTEENQSDSKSQPYARRLFHGHE